jgi:histidinol-phosphate aminotransferase
MTNEQQHHWIKPGVRGARAADGSRVDPTRHRLQWNENPYEFPADLKEIVLARLAQLGWAHYPLGLRPWGLIERIAAHHQVNANQVVAGVGSSDLIKVVMSSVLHPGDNVVLPSPTFLAYRPGVRMQQANSVDVPLAAENDFALPVDALIEAAQTNDARMVVICAPNNPTGTVYAIEDLAEVARACGGLLLVDAAYTDFSGQDFTPLLAHDNVVLVRTFSKLYAMAGVRVGYILTSPYLAGNLQKAISEFPLSVFAETAAEVALEHSQRFEPLRELILKERARLAATLGGIAGVHVYPSGTNFLLVQLDGPKQPLLEHLLYEHNLLVSDLAAYPELANCVRVSVGTPEQNDIVIAGFRGYFA